MLDCSGTAFAIQTLDTFRHRLLSYSYTEQLTEVYKYFTIIFNITIIIAYNFVKYIQNYNHHPAVKFNSISEEIIGDHQCGFRRKKVNY